VNLAVFRSIGKIFASEFETVVFGQSSFFAVVQPLNIIDQNVQCGRLDRSRLLTHLFLRLLKSVEKLVLGFWAVCFWLKQLFAVA